MYILLVANNGYADKCIMLDAIGWKSEQCYFQLEQETLNSPRNSLN